LIAVMVRRRASDELLGAHSRRALCFGPELSKDTG
jgi:hypothetical protein